MKRRRHLVAEFLEPRALLSSLSYSLTTDHPVYEAGQPIKLVFTETNEGNEPVTVLVSPTDFAVSENGAIIWHSASGENPPPPESKTLEPGESIIQTATWDGTVPFETGSSGALGRVSSLRINQFGSFTVSNPNGPPSLTASFQITDPVIASLTTDQSKYQLGEAVKATFTEINTAAVPVTLPPMPPSAFLVSQNGSPLWHVAYPQLRLSLPIVLSPGETVSHSQTLSIIPDIGPYTLERLTGVFDLEYGPSTDPDQYSTTFVIAAPSLANLETILSTDQSTYPVGQPVRLTFSETNIGTEPIVVLAGPTSFVISRNGAPFWSSSSHGATPIQKPTWLTLQPGDTYAQTDTWDPGEKARTSTLFSGPLTATNELDLRGGSASFRILTSSASTLPPAPPEPGPPSQAQAPPAGGAGALPSTYPVVATLIPRRAAYRSGQAVRLSMILRNTSDSRIALKTNPQSDGITVARGSEVVYRSSRVGGIAGSLRPRRVVKMSLVWSGRPNQPGFGGLAPGTYTVHVVKGGYSASAVIRIVGRGGPA